MQNMLHQAVPESLRVRHEQDAPERDWQAGVSCIVCDSEPMSEFKIRRTSRSDTHLWSVLSYHWAM